MTRASLTCRRGPGPRVHHCSWWHEDLVESYRTARRAQEDRAEAATLAYQTELSDYFETVERRVTFRAWLAEYRERRDLA